MVLDQLQWVGGLRLVTDPGQNRSLEIDRTMFGRLYSTQNVLGILLKTILKIRNNRFYKNFYSKNFRMLHGFDTFLGIFGGKINIESTSENI